nr:MAG TPA: hypothetical protein [Caudoviricetes sp.]
MCGSYFLYPNKFSKASVLVFSFDNFSLFVRNTFSSSVNLNVNDLSLFLPVAFLPTFHRGVSPFFTPRGLISFSNFFFLLFH